MRLPQCLLEKERKGGREGRSLVSLSQWLRGSWLGQGRGRPGAGQGQGQGQWVCMEKHLSSLPGFSGGAEHVEAVNLALVPGSQV